MKGFKNLMIYFFGMMGLLGLSLIIWKFTKRSCSVNSLGMGRKFVVVDMQKLIQSSGNIQKQIEDLYQQTQSKIQSLQHDFQTSVSQYNAQSKLLDKSTRTRKKQELQKKMVEVQQQIAQLQAKAQEEHRSLVQPVSHQYEAVISELRKKEKISVVFNKNKNEILDFDPQLDWTDKVMNELKKKQEKKEN